jgi:hypothetical protein
LGELLLESADSFCPTELAWGDMATDRDHSPSMIRFLLKKSNCDQFGVVADIFLGKTESMREGHSVVC